MQEKGKRFQVRVLSSEDFIDFKDLFSEMALNIAKDSDGNAFNLSDAKVFRFEKGRDELFFSNTVIKLHNGDKLNSKQLEIGGQGFKKVKLGALVLNLHIQRHYSAGQQKKYLISFVTAK